MPEDADNEGMGKYVRAVRGDNIDNDFTDNNDGTITDESTGLMWMQADGGLALEWDDALAYAEDFEYAVDNEGNDTHGAGAVRFSPKYTESTFAGEGGDNIINSIRLVRNVD